MASKHRNMFHKNKKQETTEIGFLCIDKDDNHQQVTSFSAEQTAAVTATVVQPPQQQQQQPPEDSPTHKPSPVATPTRKISRFLVSPVVESPTKVVAPKSETQQALEPPDQPVNNDTDGKPTLKYYLKDFIMFKMMK
ncbi:hypothetical protein AAG570_004669 [Ranatra chinensis]|uniref:Uncharacterized protein n=1 Tax=Ranatra chinensis TaxID=642074 RepID=A0ABD0YG59_9HEMI